MGLPLSYAARVGRMVGVCALWASVSSAALAQPSPNSLVPGIQPYAPREGADGTSAHGGPPVDQPTATRAVTVAPEGASVARSAQVPVHVSPDADYVLGSGDKLRITVFGEDNLSGEFNIGGNGQLAFPLIGDVPAAGRSVDAVAQAITAALKQGYIKDPRVSAEVLTFRPFYVFGEVNKPGEYPYENGLTVLNAVATAGGFSYRANKKFVFMKRVRDAKELRVRLTPELTLLPGDTVRIGERLF